MTDRQQLIRKHRQGTLTDAEYQEYLALMRDDPTFQEDVELDRMLTQVTRQDKNRLLWEAVQAAEADATVRPLSGGSRPWNTYAMAACVAGLLGWVTWLLWPSLTGSSGPELVRTEKRDVRLLLDETTKGYDDYGGSVWLRWFENSRQQDPQTYTFCRDTLTVYLKNSRDTTQWQSVQLLFNADQQKLYVQLPNQPRRLLSECLDNPQPLSFTP